MPTHGVKMLKRTRKKKKQKVISNFYMVLLVVQLYADVKGSAHLF